VIQDFQGEYSRSRFSGGVFLFRFSGGVCSRFSGGIVPVQSFRLFKKIIKKKKKKNEEKKKQKTEKQEKKEKDLSFFSFRQSQRLSDFITGLRF
jgi:hypothetical protein